MSLDTTNLEAVIQYKLSNLSNVSEVEVLALRALLDKYPAISQTSLDNSNQADINALTNASPINQIVKVGIAAAEKETRKPHGEFLPMASLWHQNLYIKLHQTTDYNSNEGQFFTQAFVSANSYGLDNPNTGMFPRQYALASAGGNEDIVVDIHDDGILTSIVSPCLSSVNDIEIKITRDGYDVKTYRYTMHSVNNRLAFGVIPWSSTETSSPAGLGTYRDGGFGNAQYLLVSPMQAINLGFGLRFKKSVKIEFISPSGVGWSTVTNSRYYAVGYSRMIPTGFEE